MSDRRTPSAGQRLQSIDMLRGLVMVIMALDHVRAMLTSSLPAMRDFAAGGAPLFFTRWVTHLCAPTFVLLAGTSAYLFGSKVDSTQTVSRFLFTRGLWLVFVELTVVCFAWNFNLGPRFVVALQVIWAIGVSMIALAGMVWLPRSAIAGIGIAMIVGHNLLDAVQPAPEAASAVWALLHIQGPLRIGGTTVAFVGYPLIPWIGVMALGYAIGPLFVGVDAERPRRLLRAGMLLTLAFVALRVPNLYGEPNAWQAHATWEATLIDFLDTTKYPPSLHFLLMTLGPVLMLLGLFERVRGPVADALVLVGRVPFFFYVVHLYVIHLVALGVAWTQGISMADVAVVFFFYPPEFGVGLGAVYLLWVPIVLALYPACQWFAGVKSRRRDWWLSYL